MSDGKDIDHELLASYENGPRIWDAADIYQRVLELAEAGFIEPAPVHGAGAYQLTMAGSLELGRVVYSRKPAPPEFVANWDQAHAEIRDKIDGLLATFRPAAAALGEDHATWSLTRHLLDDEEWEPYELAIMLAVAVRQLAAVHQEQP